MTEPHPVCPRCRMETIRLVLNGKACDWCRGKEEPVTRKRWEAMLAQVERRIEERVAADQARLEHRDCKVCGGGYTVPPTSRATTCSKDCSKVAQAVQRR